MKYIVILGDGMADYPIEKLNNKTPLDVANKPFIDGLCAKGEIGLVKTVPDGMKPGSDVANLSVLGYNPKKVYSGRSPLEAASIGINLKDTDISARANLVTLSNEEKFEDKRMIDYSAGEISTEEAKEIISYLAGHLNNEKYSLYAGISYRHCLVADKGSLAGDLTPPHDITGKPIKEYLPKSEAGKEYLELMKKSYELLKNHPVNLKRIKDGKNPATCIWCWGEGTKPNLQSFEEKYNLKGGIISAVDLLKGIAKLSKMRSIEVDGATGTYETNFSGKAKACIDALKNGLDYIYIHMEAPDECGHHGDLENKIYSIEQIDKVVEYIVNELDKMGEEYKILICPDHPTPIKLMTHVSDPIPFVIYDSRVVKKGADKYNEQNALSSGLSLDSGEQLVNRFLI